MPNYRALAVGFARKYGIDPNAFVRQIQQESSFNPNATSGAGAQGIAQIMPSTARAWGVNPRNPAQALEAAAAHMAQYQKQTGSLKGALEMYNLGHTAPDGQLPAETRNYVAKITGGRGGASSGNRGVPAAPGGAITPGSAAARALAMQMLGMGGGGLGGGDPLLGILSQLAGKPSTPSPSTQQPVTGTPSHGTAMFDGKPVEPWIAPILAEARKTGLWKGAVTSGQRTKAQQLAAAKGFGLQHYGPAGPLGSNHLAGRGAVDVSDPQGFKRALQTLHINRLKSAMANDPVHFSASGF